MVSALVPVPNIPEDPLLLNIEENPVNPGPPGPVYITKYIIPIANISPITMSNMFLLVKQYAVASSFGINSGETVGMMIV